MLVEAGAGERASLADDGFAAAGATLVVRLDADDLWHADVVLKWPVGYRLARRVRNCEPGTMAQESVEQVVERFDLVVIGSGPAGEKGAVQAAYFGKKVALVEKSPTVGGACVHTGTLPSKTLREAALYVTGFQRRQLYGMTLDIDRDASLRRLMGRLHTVIDQQVAQIAHNLARHDVALIKGDAEMVGPHELTVRSPIRRSRRDACRPR